MSQTTSEEQVQTTQTASPSVQPIQNPDRITISRRFFISVSALALFASFFLPWTTIFGKGLSGLDIQQNFSSYKLVWLLPVCALLAFILNLVGRGTNLMRRVAGAVPFIILAYSLNRFGSDFWQLIALGGWVALASGAVLELIPNPPKRQPKG
jgi:hypothetical protein